ncbi:MAG: Ppx/GppA phosphatase family protein [Myxococcota bacterium]
MPRFAAIDVGSNASRLLIVQAKEPTRIREVRSLRVPVRMGHEVFQTGELNPRTIDQAVDTMRQFAQAIEDARVDDYRAIVTASARSARNGAELLERVRTETGIALDAIDGTEEARIVGLAVRNAMELPGPAILMDLGGGSLEVTDLTPGGRFTVSLAIGTVRLLEAFLDPGKPVSEAQDRLIREYIDRLLAPHRRDLRAREWSVMVGTGGNLNAAAALAPAPELHPVPTIDVPRARELLDELKALPKDQRIARYDLRPDRADVLVPALYVIVAMADFAKVRRVACPGVGMKEGIVRELVDKHYRVWDYGSERDVLLAAALQLGRRYHFDERHATQVASLSMELFEATKKLHGLGAEDRGLLRLAALLHDIGDFVSPQSHHKHSQYLIANSDLVGLPPERRDLVAQIARYHRRALPATRHEPYRALNEEDRRRVDVLAGLLRIADAFDRGHQGKVKALNPRLKRRELVLEPESDHDLSLEAWTAERKADLFRQALDRELRVKLTEGQSSPGEVDAAQ